MKKLNYFMLGLAGLALASCSQDDLTAPKGEGNYHVRVQLPSDMGTRAYTGGLAATQLNVAIYDMEGNFVDEVKGATFDENELSTEVNFHFATGASYQIAFFAQSPNSKDVYQFNPNPATGEPNITVDYDAMNSTNNDADDYDCFYRLFETGIINSEADLTETVLLYRPIAKINWGTDDYGVKAIEQAFGENGEFVGTTLTTKAYNTFSLLDSNVTGEEVDITIGMTPDYFSAPKNWYFPAGTQGETPQENQYQYVAMQYVLAPSGESTVYDLTLNVNNSANTHLATTTVTNDIVVTAAPVQANYQTNIYGSLLTDNVDITVEKSPTWGGMYDVPQGEPIEPGLYLNSQTNTYTITTAAGLKAYASIVNQKANGNYVTAQYCMRGTTVLLGNDIDMSGVSYTPFPNGSATFDGQGHTISNLTSTATGTQNTLNQYAGFMNLGIGTIKNVTFDNATITSNNFAGIIANGESTIIDNVTVKNSTITSLPYNNDGGNNIGAVVGYLNASSTASVTNCTVDNCKIQGYRQVGGIVGRLNGDGGNPVCTGNTVTNTTIICNMTSNYKNLDEPTDIGEVYGQDVTGTAVLSGNTATDVEILTINPQGKIEVSTLDQLQAIADLGNAFYYLKTVEFPENTTIDLDGATITPIDFGMRGDFDQFTFVGNGLTIKNFTVDATGYQYAGLFARLGGSISNVTIDNMTISGGTNGCGFIGQFNGSMTNVTVQNSKFTAAPENAGALVGINPGGSGFTNCHSINNTVSGGDRIGGMVGTVNDTNRTSTFSGCTVIGGSITSDVPNTAGSFVGQAFVPVEYTNCTANTTVNGTAVTTPGNYKE